MDFNLTLLIQNDKKEAKHLADYGKTLQMFQALFIEGKFEKCLEKCERYLERKLRGKPSVISKIDEVFLQTATLLMEKNSTSVNIVEELNQRFRDIEFIPVDFKFATLPSTLPELPKLSDVPRSCPNPVTTPVRPVTTSRRSPTPASVGVHHDFFCIICKKGFTKMFSLNRHMMIHNGTKNHRCKMCHRAFIQKSDLQRHEESHKVSFDVACTFIGCQKQFKTRKNMTSHLVTHFPKIRNLKCKHCERAFNRIQSLKLHEANHEDKRFQCDVCGKSFVCKSYTRSHMKVHQEAKPFQCPVCFDSFKRRYDMSFHYRNQHKDAFEAP